MKPRLSRREELLAAADVITRFVSGPIGNWEWDDFTSLASQDPAVEVVRLEAVAVCDNFPPDHRGGWTSEAGMKRLLEIAERARNEAGK